MIATSAGPIKKLLIATYHRLDLWIAPEWFSERLAKDFPGLEIVRLTNYDNVEIEIADAEIAFTFSLRPEQFQPRAFNSNTFGDKRWCGARARENWQEQR